MIKKTIKYLLFTAIALLPGLTLASKAGVVIKKSDGSVKQNCVEFNSESISGWELLKSSGFNPVSKNGFLVEIDGLATKDNAQMGSSDPFWSYWKYNTSWLFQNVGATYSKVYDGTIEGWEYGNGKSSLPSVSFEQICPAQKKEEVKVEEVIDQKVNIDNEQRLPLRSPEPTPSITQANTMVKETVSVSPSSSSTPTMQIEEKINIPQFKLKNVIFLFLSILAVGFLLNKFKKK